MRASCKGDEPQAGIRNAHEIAAGSFLDLELIEGLEFELPIRLEQKLPRAVEGGPSSPAKRTDSGKSRD